VKSARCRNSLLQSAARVAGAMPLERDVDALAARASALVEGKAPWVRTMGFQPGFTEYRPKDLPGFGILRVCFHHPRNGQGKKTT